MITVITGTMFSGKTTELLQQINLAKKRIVLKDSDQDIKIFKPSFDNRYKENYIVTHDKKEIEAVPVRNAIDILKHCDTFTNDYVFIDEAQFFKKDIVTVALRLSNMVNNVMLVCLEHDYLHRPFGYSNKLMKIADEIIIKEINCMTPDCKNKATHNKRLINDKVQFYLGSDKQYQAVCEEHYDH